jgi:hypothetical protein
VLCTVLCCALHCTDRVVCCAVCCVPLVLQGSLADQLLQVWEFACCFSPLLGLEQVPSLQQLERGLLAVVSHTGGGGVLWLAGWDGGGGGAVWCLECGGGGKGPAGNGVPHRCVCGGGGVRC